MNLDVAPLSYPLQDYASGKHDGERAFAARRHMPLCSSHKRQLQKMFSLGLNVHRLLLEPYAIQTAGKSILEVAIDRLTPKTHDADGVVAALQFTHPRFLGPDVVSMNQVFM